MRVVIRTPAEIVAEYNLADLDEQASDEMLLAAAAASQPISSNATEIIGPAYVAAAGRGALAAQGRRLHWAADQLSHERRVARKLALAAFRRGTSKLAIANMLGIARVTLDTWLSEAGRPRKRRQPAPSSDETGGPEE